MDTLRERHLARHGMGHANRPRQHHIISLDSQPWRVRLPAGWSRHSNPNTDRIANSYGYADGNGNRNRNTHCNGDAHSNNYTDRQADADT